MTWVPEAVGSDSCWALTEPAGAREAALAERSRQTPRNPVPRLEAPLLGRGEQCPPVHPHWGSHQLSGRSQGSVSRKQQALSATSFLV